MTRARAVLSVVILTCLKTRVAHDSDVGKSLYLCSC